MVSKTAYIFLKSKLTTFCIFELLHTVSRTLKRGCGSCYKSVTLTETAELNFVHTAEYCYMVVLGTALGTLMVPGYWSLQMG